MPDLATFQLAFATAMKRTGRHGSLERQPGFAVYRNTSPVALVETLRGNYPVVAELLGEQVFTGAALDFVRACPPTSPVLVGYGAGFADFLAAQDWAADLPYLADVAAIDRLRTEAQVAADRRALDWRDLAALGADQWQALRLPLHPATRFAWLSTPALTIWQAHLEGFETLEPEWRAEGVLVARPLDAVTVHALSAPAHRMLSGLRLGESAGQAAAATAAVYPEADLASLFATLVNSGALALPRQLERT